MSDNSIEPPSKPRVRRSRFDVPPSSDHSIVPTLDASSYSSSYVPPFVDTQQSRHDHMDPMSTIVMNEAKYDDMMTQPTSTSITSTTSYANIEVEATGTMMSADGHSHSHDTGTGRKMSSWRMKLQASMHVSSETTTTFTAINHHSSSYDSSNVHVYGFSSHPPSLPDSEAPPAATFIPATDPAYRSRLQKALDKNLAFIRRKDSDLASIVSNQHHHLQQRMNQHQVPSSSSLSMTAAVMSSNSSYAHYSTSSSMPSKLDDTIASHKPPIGQTNRTGIGIGPVSNSHPHQHALSSGSSHRSSSSSVESCSVYVTGLPPDFTTEELEILFGVGGKVPLKRVKVYKNHQGRNKGDALITFQHHHQASVARLQYDGLDIGDGYTIHVAGATFTETPSSSSPSPEKMIPDEDDDVIKMMYPACQADVYPVVIICQQPSSSSSYMDMRCSMDDMLVECCMHGDLLSLTPIHRHDKSSLSLSSSSSMIVAAVATYRDVAGARMCVAAYHHRQLADHTTMTASLHMPPSSQHNQHQHDDHDDDQTMIEAPLQTPPISLSAGAAMPHIPATSIISAAVDGGDDMKHQDDDVDVDDFLNSLL